MEATFPGGASAATRLGLVVTVFLTASASQIQRVPLRHRPLLAVSRTDNNSVTLLSGKNEEKEVATIPLACKGPFGLDFASHRRWLYVACWDHAQIALIDLRSHREPQIFSGSSLPAWVRRRERSDEMWISNEGAGKITIYRSGLSTVLGEIVTGKGPSDIMFTESGRKAWVSNEGADTISVIDAQRRLKIRDIPVGKVPQGIALTAGQDRLLVANFGENSLSVIDPIKAVELARIPVCGGPIEVASYRQNGIEKAYVSCYKDGLVAVIDLASGRETQRLDVGEKPFGIVAVPALARIYVCVGGSNQVVVIGVGRLSRVLRRIKMEGNPLRIAAAS